ncbi:unnamed protein product, partial [marine sediment metagenome]
MKSVYIKIASWILATIIIAGVAYGAYYFFNKSEAIGK